MRPKMKFIRNKISLHHKKNMFTLLFTARETNETLQRDGPLNNTNKPKRDIEIIISEATIYWALLKEFCLKLTQEKTFTELHLTMNCI